MTSPQHTEYDLIVVGSGIAGLYAALQAHEAGARVLVVTKGGSAHRVRLEARRGAGVTRRAEAVITRAPAKLAPYFVVEWSG